MYNYLEAVKNDVREYIKNEINLNEWKGNREELEEKLNNDLWICDSVTGNGSGSYTFNSDVVKENIFHDTETVIEALKEFDFDAETIAKKFLNKEWEYFDVTARCYVLEQAISEILDELENELEEDSEEE